MDSPVLIKLDQKNSFSSSFADPRLHIISFKFMITCESRTSEWVFTEDSEVTCSSEKTNLPLYKTFFSVVTREQFARHEKAREILSEELGNSAMEPDELRKLIDHALGEAREMVGCMPPHHNALHLTYQVKADKLLFFDEGKKGRVVGVVPSTESSLQEDRNKIIGYLKKARPALKKARPSNVIKYLRKTRPEPHNVIKYLKKVRPSKVIKYLGKARPAPHNVIKYLKKARPNKVIKYLNKARLEPHKVIKYLKKARPSKVFGYLMKARPEPHVTFVSLEKKNN